MSKRAGLNVMTEEQAKEAYKYVVENAFSKSKTEMAEYLKVSIGTVMGMVRRLKAIGIEMPNGLRSNVLHDNEFVNELKGLRDSK